MKIFFEPLQFEWNKGNEGKNLIKHKVSDEECEEVFFDPNRRVAKDVCHSEK